MSRRHLDLGPILRDEPPHEGERRKALDHLRDCAECRASVATAEPAKLFSLLALEPLPETVLARVSRGAAEAFTRERSRRLRRRRAAFGAVAASLLLVAVLAILSRMQPEVGTTVALGPTHPATGVAASAPTDGAIPAGMIELLDSPGSAEVIEMTVGDVEVVMIFDAAMGI